MQSATDFDNAAPAKSGSLALDIIQSMGLELGIAIGTLILASVFSHLRQRVTPHEGKKVRSTKLPTTVSRPTARYQAPRADPSAAKGPNQGGMPAVQAVRFVEQVISMKLSTGKTLEGYTELKNEGRHLRLSEDMVTAGSLHTVEDFYASLIQCAGRIGRNQLVRHLLEDAEAAGVEPSIRLHESAMRLLAGKTAFQEALTVFMSMEKKGLQPSATTMSCAIGFAFELNELDMAVDIFARLCGRATPSLRACMSILRVYAKRADWDSSVKLLSDAKQLGVNVDSVLLNIVLCTGVSAGKVDEAEGLLSEVIGCAHGDVVSYNTVLKGLAQTCNVDRALNLLYSMIDRGVQPNTISFNTVLDATVRAHRDCDTWKLYEMMVQEGAMRPDKFTCSTLMKSFVINKQETEKRVTMMLDLLDQVASECTSRLLQDVLKGVLAAALRLNDKPTTLVLASRSLGQFCRQEMPAPASELRKLLAAAVSSYFASSGDVRSQAEKLLRDVWSHVALFVPELAEAKANVDRLVAQGQSVAAATRSAMGVISGAGTREARPSRSAEFGYK